MKKILFFLTVITTVFGMQSCSNAYEPQMAAVNNGNNHEVVYVGVYTNRVSRANVDASQTSEQFVNIIIYRNYDTC